jgi:hypothetical protein
MAARGVTLREIRETWPATVPVSRAASPLGVSRSSAYEAIRRGDFPVKTISVGRRIVVLTADLVRVLSGGSDAAT